MPMQTRLTLFVPLAITTGKRVAMSDRAGKIEETLWISLPLFEERKT
jgi:hypothetical protein